MPNKHLLFLVHGMGDHGSGWSKNAQDILEKSYKKYPQLSWKSFKSRFECHEILYDKEFEALREHWRTQQKALGELVASQGIALNLVKKLNKLSSLTDKDSYINTHVLDVLLYRYARQTASAVRDTVRRQILDVLKKQDSSEPIVWSVIAHSLGTSVLHDALHGLFSDRTVLNGAGLGDVTRPQAVAMVANVSRLLQSDVKAYQSLVRPGAPEDAHITRYYLNVRHEWDPVPAPRAFRPKADWPSPEVRERRLYREVKISAIDDKNIHALEHYLRNPLVHTAIFNALLDFDVIDTGTVESAHLKYVSKTPSGLFEAAVKELKAFQLAEEDSLERVLKAWIGFIKSVKE